ncbi:MAG: HDOD domain-containing protein [Fibrobacterota bacterium]
MQQKEELKQITDKITGLPTLPTVITRITQLMQNPHTTADEVGKAITTDQSLASKVLKLVNSAFYGFPGRINTITHAIVILGFNTVKNIVLTASIFEVFGGRDSDSFDIEKFWLHSIACGATSKTIAEHLKLKSAEECFISGLLHDIGKLIFDQYVNEDFAKVVKAASKKNILIKDAENEMMGVSHNEIGGWLCNKWKLPDDLRNAVQYHHSPELADDKTMTTTITHFSDVLVKALNYGSGGDNRVPQVSEYSWKKLNMNRNTLDKMLPVIDSEVDKAAVFLQIL